jgi:hypothetical protein
VVLGQRGRRGRPESGDLAGGLGQGRGWEGSRGRARPTCGPSWGRDAAGKRGHRGATGSGRCDRGAPARGQPGRPKRGSGASRCPRGGLGGGKCHRERVAGAARRDGQQWQPAVRWLAMPREWSSSLFIGRQWAAEAAT